jgi:hypothetical protein
MALEGNLSAFGLSEILQLIAVQQKTGMLTVSSQDSNAVMFFRDGSIISTRDRRRKAKDPFKEYLTRYGVLSREQLIKITQISSQSKLDLLDILKSEGFMSEDELRKHFQKQIQEAMHEVLSWDQCAYKFISNEDVVDGIRTIGEFSIEGMLMESMRRIDEFPQMLEMFPSDQILIAREDRDEELEEEEEEEEMTQNQKAILALLDENILLRDLISIAKMPLFEVYESLKLLKEKGLIKTKEEQPKVIAEGVAAAAKKAAAIPRRNPFPFLLVLVLFLATLFLGVHGFVQNFDAQRAAVVESIESNSIARNQVEENLRWLIEAYRAEHGVYPPTLNALVDAGLATPRLMKMVDLFSFRYQLTPRRPTYTLL